MSDKIIDEIIKLMGNWGAGTQVIGLMVLIFSMAFFMLKDFRNATINFVMIIAKHSNDNPERHPFFMQRILIGLQIDKIKFPDRDKTWLFKTLLRLQVEITFEILTEFVIQQKWRKMKRIELQGALMLLLKKIIDTYEQRILEAFRKKYDKIGKEMWDLVYFGGNGFKSYHSKNIELVERNISKIFIIESFNNAEILNSFILQIWVAIDTAINDCVMVFTELNGNLKALIKKYYEMEA